MVALQVENDEWENSHQFSIDTTRPPSKIHNTPKALLV